MNPIIIIPARLAASRLPGKPLADIGGKPMIVHVWERAMAAAIGPVAVAAGDPEIAAAITAVGGIAVLTDPDLPSGSDRVDQALRILDPGRRHDIVVNLQGDLPGLPPGYISAVLKSLAGKNADIGTLVAPIKSPAEAAAEQVVKAVCAFPDDSDIAPALYFSRNAVPWGPGPLWHHIGIYAWRREALAKFVTLPPSLLEQREKLEQLRALEAGMRIWATKVATAPFGIDTQEDLARARAELRAKAG
jgi:3-deoxy-manno-octulosonate cytidylyltransferase (CMP-KDO synthetase)